ncbi:MAG TPA: hypothetical protein VNM14_21050 [Planctomycetota bacterium]|nr:hypothetical protein [Planctomycetota bacterium]
MNHALAPTLGLGLLLISSGCAHPRVRQEEKRVLVDVGMTGREVSQRIGRPSKVFAVEPVPGAKDQTVEVWAYTMKIPPDLGDAAEFAIGAGALVVLSAATGRVDAPPFPEFLLRAKGRCSFWVGFGSDGRVRGVTNLEELR